MGLIHLDAGLIIGFLDGDDAHHDASCAALSDVLGRSDRLAIAASALGEYLVGHARRGPEAIELVRTVIDRLPVSVVALNAEIGTQAAVLRARHRALKLSRHLVAPLSTDSSSIDVSWARVRRSVLEMLERSGLMDRIGKDHIFVEVDDAVNDFLGS